MKLTSQRTRKLETESMKEIIQKLITITQITRTYIVDGTLVIMHYTFQKNSIKITDPKSCQNSLFPYDRQK